MGSEMCIRDRIIHSNGLKTHLLAALAKPPGAKLIWHLHDFISTRSTTRWLLPVLQRRASFVIAVSDAVAKDASSVLRGIPIRTVLNGVSEALVEPRPADLDLLSGLSPSSGATRVGLVATYASWKGHRLFIDAAAGLRDPSLRFYIVGGPVYSTRGSQLSVPTLQEEVRRHDLSEHCGLVPFQREMSAVYAALDVVVSASTRPEPFGRAIAEAMMSGRTVIAPAEGGPLEQITPDLTGLLFEARSMESLRASLSRVVSDSNLRRRLGQAARTHALAHLNAKRMGPETLEVYRSLGDPPSGVSASSDGAPLPRADRGV